jgi:hypothetical protein
VKKKTPDEKAPVPRRDSEEVEPTGPYALGDAGADDHGEGPSVSGGMGPVGDEPAWTGAQGDLAPPDEESSRDRELRERRRPGVPPLLSGVALVIAAAIAVLVAKPAWLGFDQGATPQPAATAGPPPPLPGPLPASGAREKKEGPVAGSVVGGAREKKEAPVPGPVAGGAREKGNSAHPERSEAESKGPAATASPTPPLPGPLPASGVREKKEGPVPGSVAGGAREKSNSAHPERSEAESKGATPPPRPRVAKKADPLQTLLTDARRLRNRGRTPAALELYARALDEAPQNADALAGRGLCYLDLSQYAQAESSFEAALGEVAEHGDALMGLAETFRYEGRRADAVKYYERYLAAHPRGESAAAARNAIEAMKE